MPLNLTLAVVGGLVLGLGLVSNGLKRAGVPDKLVALGVGVLLGPAVLGWLDPAVWGEEHHVVEQVARITLGIGLMGVALRLPGGYHRRDWRSLALLLSVGMVGMWLLSSTLVGLILGLPLWTALLVGAVVTPTDPIVASAIVTGEVAEANLPERLRHVLSSESGLNDGLAYPFVLLPLLMLARPEGEAWGHWLSHVLLWEVGAAVVLGFVLGAAAGKGLAWATERDLIERPSFLAFTLALALLVLGAVRLLGSDGILAVFVAGLAFDAVVDVDEQASEERIVEAIDRFFTLPIFALLGLVLPWDQWAELGGRGLALAAAVIVLRRLPVLLALKRPVPCFHAWRDALFAGWFGPVGVAALFYATLALRRSGEAGGAAWGETAWAVGTLAITASLLVHGLTATPLTKWYGRLAPDEPTTVEDERDRIEAD
ncbi:MAG: cation:proton antiporter [Rhodothermales bacterium]|nr:cation:proton antiporter [Rhodothermales bacterium]